MHIRILQETISNMVWDIRYHLVTWQTPPAAPNGSIIEAAARNLVTPIHQHDAPSKTSRLSDNIHRVLLRMGLLTGCQRSSTSMSSALLYVDLPCRLPLRTAPFFPLSSRRAFISFRACACASSTRGLNTM